jgi:hypothetical protein
VARRFEEERVHWITQLPMQFVPVS